MNILNLCNNFVKEYLSVENIIFNMVLFERFYEDNPINILTINSLKEIEKELNNKNEYNEKEKSIDNLTILKIIKK